ncbi:MAG: transglycosylase SLT domain-containing protein [Acidobacteriota bacterium]
MEPIPETEPASDPVSESSPSTAETPEPQNLVAVQRLYDRLAEDRQAYEESIELLGAGEEMEEEELQAIADRLKAGANECAKTQGCDWNRFLDALNRLLGEQARVLSRQASRIEGLVSEAEEGIEREPGTSPFISAMPEMGTTVSLLRGTDLRDIIKLNGPVKAALDDWLTWMRPMLMDAYENYQFLRKSIAPIYEEAGLPEALLFALIATETGGKVHSYSWRGAAGPLQFMRHTGRRYGLKVVDGFDMRLDPVAATKASVAYLNDQFNVLNNSLEKALAAYNGGENRVRRLHRRFKGASLWDRRIYYSLPRETREYVPRILAAAWLFLHPGDYNLEWPKLDGETTRLVVKEAIAIGELTVCLGQVQNRNGWFRTLRNLNPRLSPGQRVEAGETIEIPTRLVPYYEKQCLGGEPIERARELHDANYPFGEMISYVVQRGDTLGRIASRFRCVSIRELAAINNIRPPRYVIRVGQRLKIPSCD